MTPKVPSTTLPHPAARPDLAILRHPDRRTGWVIAVCATLAEPLANPIEHYGRRLAELHERLPILGARLHGEVWHPGTVAGVEVIDGDPIESPSVLRNFALDREAPVRLVVGARGRRLGLAAHHAALDGRSQVAVLAALQGAPLPPPVVPPPPGAPERRLQPMRRLLQPADAIVPSLEPPSQDILLTRPIALRGPHATAKLAEACVGAVAARNARLGRPLRRIGLSIAVGGPDCVGNVASYRRLDLAAGAPVREAVIGALASTVVPGELVAPTRVLRALAPVVDRFSDTLLVSNIGRCDIPGATTAENFPVARGRSAIAFGCGGIAGHGSTLTMRVRDLSRAEATALIDDVAQRLAVRDAEAAPPALALRHPHDSRVLKETT